MAETQIELNGKKGFGTRNTKYVKIVDENKIPREFLVPDMVAIKEAMSQGKKVAGCEWDTKQTITV
jgi:FKBP-type peptidyl-prolyl cis-trans isomerase 2